MATLSGNKIKDTYQSLIKLTDNGNLTTGAKQLTDGFGNNSPLYISTTQIGIGVTPEATYDLHVYSNAKVGGNLTVTGDLTVEGTTTTIDTQTLTVEDPLIEVASNNTSTDAVDIGWYGKYAPSGTTLYAGLFRDTGDSKFKLFRNLQEQPTTTVNTSGTGYTVATLVADLEGTLTGVIASTTTATTQTLADNSTKVATTAYVDASIDNHTLAEVLANGDTTGGGNIVFGDSDVFLTDDTLMFGASNDLVIYHDGSNSFIREKGTGNLYIDGETSISLRKYTGAENMLVANTDGAVELYYDASKKLETTTTGVTVTGAVSATTFSGQLDGTISSATTATTQSQNDNSTKVATTAYVDLAVDGVDTLSEILANGNTTGATKIEVDNTSSGIDFIDDAKLRIGTDNDLSIYHSSSNSFIDADINNLYLRVQSTDSDMFLQSDDGSGGLATYVFLDGSTGKVELNHYGTKKFETTTSGATVSGLLTVNGDGAGNVLSFGLDKIIQFNTSLDFFDLNGLDTAATIEVDGITADTFNGQLVGTISSSTTATTQTQGDNSTKVATTAYVDTAVGNNNELSEVLANGNTTGGTDIAVSAGDNITFTDTSIAYFGSGNHLAIEHSGTLGQITNSTGDLYVQSTNDDVIIRTTADNKDIFIQSDDGSGGISTYFQADGSTGAVNLYHYGSKKFETTSSGVQVTGTANSNALYLYEGDFTMHGGSSGQNDIRWINTWGNWRIEVGDGANNFKIHSESSGEDYLTIDGSGNVGINEINPDTILHISDGNTSDPSTNAPVIRLQNTSENCSAFFTDGDVIGGLEFYNDSIICTDIAYAAGVNAYFRAVHDGASSPTPTSSLEFGTGTGGSASTKMTIDSSGTTTITNGTFDNTLLLLNGARGRRLRVQEHNTGNGGIAITSQDDDETGTTNANNRTLLLNASGGNVGIGTDSPTNLLDIKSNGSSKGLDIHHSNGNIVAQLIHGGSGDEGQLKLYDSNVETVRISGENNIDSYINSGNLLINQTSSATTAKLQVDGDIDMTGSAPTAIRLYDGVTFKGGLGDGQWAFGSTSYANDYALYAQNDLLFHAGTGSSIDMMIDGATHYVGIGDSPQTLLDIHDDSPVLRISATNQSASWAVGTEIGKLEFWTTDSSGNAPYDTGFISIENDFAGGTLPSGAMVFGTATYNASGGAVERMRIDSSGNVGIGTESPTGGAIGGKVVHLVNSGSTASFRVDRSDSSTTGTISLIDTNSTIGLYGTGEKPMAFSTNSTERMRIDGSGNTIYPNNGTYFRHPGTYGRTTASSANMFIYTDGQFYRSTSSLKYKTNVNDYDKGLNEVLSLRPVYYNGTGDSDGDKTFSGLIAEEVHDLGLTEFVEYAEDETPDGLAYGHMVALLTKAIQEQQDIINDLKARIEILENN
jgi:hypothetical protein